MKKNFLLTATMLGAATAFSAAAFAADVTAPEESLFSMVIDGWAGGLFLMAAIILIRTGRASSSSAARLVHA